MVPSESQPTSARAAGSGRSGFRAPPQSSYEIGSFLLALVVDGHGIPGIVHWPNNVFSTVRSIIPSQLSGMFSFLFLCQPASFHFVPIHTLHHLTFPCFCAHFHKQLPHFQTLRTIRSSRVSLNVEGSKILQSEYTRSYHKRNLHCSLKAAVNDDSRKKRVVFLGTPEVAASSLRRIFQRSKDPGSFLHTHDDDTCRPRTTPRTTPASACGNSSLIIFLAASNYEVVAVVSNPPAPSGRKMVLTVRAHSRPMFTNFALLRPFSPSHWRGRQHPPHTGE
jgi:hypothetical protein